MTLYDDMIRRRKHQFGLMFDDSDLDPRFIKFYNNGARVGVKLYGDEVTTGRIGVTTGWTPAFLLMRRSSDRGSSHLLGPSTEIVKVKETWARVYRDARPSDSMALR